jgi:two-component system chemotaxis response regulator CheB
VLVVDDSAFMRRVVSDLVRECPGFDVCGTARDGTAALERVHALDPDLLTLDVAMPGLDGLQVLGYVMSEAPRPVVMLSGIDDEALTLRALELGAVDFVPKPSGPVSIDLGRVRARLHDALRAAACTNVGATRVLARAAVRAPAAPSAVPAAHVVAVAASTGGPNALAQVIPALPRPLGAAGAAVLVAQHMPAGFTASFAARLDALGALRVVEARDGLPVLADHVYVGAGSRHLGVRRDADGTARLVVADDDLPGIRPSADRLMASVAAAFGAAAVGVVLTGMGRDGAAGLRAMRGAGAGALVQARETAVVAGMPDAALALAGADAVVPLDGMAAAIVAALAALATPAPSGGAA